jgi:tetraacyldisaccharide 4'-kinase
LNQNSYRELIGGNGGGLGSFLLRFVLRLLSHVYRTIIVLRNWGYSAGWLRSHRVDVPVISIGNITTGGTGKTPLVIWLCRMLEKKGIKCVVLTRGYKAEHGNVGDEAAILAKACGGAKVVVDSDRVAGAAKAIKEHDAEMLVMDDGFQHRRLERNLDIIAIDATRPFGYGKILPAGLLREPKRSIRRADAVVITHYDQTTSVSVARIEREVSAIKPGIPIAKAIHKHPFAKETGGAIFDMDELRKKKIFAFCGIGNPDAFITRLREYGMTLVGSKIYNDHHNFSESDIEVIYEEAMEAGAEMILSTEKDWVKTALPAQRLDDIGFAYLAVELEFIEGRKEIEQLVDDVLKK